MTKHFCDPCGEELSTLEIIPGGIEHDPHDGDVGMREV